MSEKRLFANVMIPRGSVIEISVSHSRLERSLALLSKTVEGLQNDLLE